MRISRGALVLGVVGLMALNAEARTSTGFYLRGLADEVAAVGDVAPPAPVADAAAVVADVAPPAPVADADVAAPVEAAPGESVHSPHSFDPCILKI